MSGVANDIVDGYDLPLLPKDIDVADEKKFTKGRGISSDLFAIYLSEESGKVN